MKPNDFSNRARTFAEQGKDFDLHQGHPWKSHLSSSSPSDTRALVLVDQPVDFQRGLNTGQPLPFLDSMMNLLGFPFLGPSHRVKAMACLSRSLVFLSPWDPLRNATPMDWTHERLKLVLDHCKRKKVFILGLTLQHKLKDILAGEGWDEGWRAWVGKGEGSRSGTWEKIPKTNLAGPVPIPTWESILLTREKPVEKETRMIWATLPGVREWEETHSDFLNRLRTLCHLRPCVQYLKFGGGLATPFPVPGEFVWVIADRPLFNVTTTEDPGSLATPATVVSTDTNLDNPLVEVRVFKTVHPQSLLSGWFPLQSIVRESKQGEISLYLQAAKVVAK